MRYQSVLETIGKTPLIKLNRIGKGLPPEIYVKAEMFNPGGSVKDRIAIKMIEDAERRGLIKPGATIIEATSGNTGIGLAIVARLKGYQLICTTNDKQSREKIDLLKAFGAEVVVCPTAVAPDDPRSYYSVAKKLAEEIPNSYYPNQYYNPSNPQAHYETTGPEIWEDTEGRIDAFVAGMGTGGTITGVGKFLKEKKPSVKIVGADPVGSLYYEYFHKGTIGEAHTYLVEGIGEDILPATMDFSVLDDVIQVTDKESFLWARKLVKEEGIFAGGSSGSALAAGIRYAERMKPGEVMVILLPDTGTRNLGKVYNDEWMKENRFLEAPIRATSGDIAKNKPPQLPSLIFLSPADKASRGREILKKYDISQVPVIENGEIIGTFTEDRLIDELMLGKNMEDLYVREIMDPPLPVVSPEATLDEITTIIPKKSPAVLIRHPDGRWDILTKYDIIQAML
ncbi:MAG: pyridoxal-phosphate dependent enzyme [Fimbriimonadales bacterium]|nr:pyridoxal-phosphate dependent enzyme [Fimbriimonadales bacterium]